MNSVSSMAILYTSPGGMGVQGGAGGVGGVPANQPYGASPPPNVGSPQGLRRYTQFEIICTELIWVFGY